MTATTAQSFQSNVDTLRGYFPGEMSGVISEAKETLAKAKAATLNALQTLPNVQDYRVRSQAALKGDEAKKKEAAADRSEARQHAGIAFKTILFWGVAAAAFCAAAPIAWAALQAMLTGGGVLASMGTAAAATTVGSIKLAALAGVAYGVVKSSDHLGLAVEGVTNSFSHEETKKRVRNQKEAEGLHQQTQQLEADVQTLTGIVQDNTAKQQQLDSVSQNPVFNQTDQNAPTWDNLLMQMAQTQNLNNKALLQAIPDNAFDSTTIGHVPFQKTTHILKSTAANDLLDAIERVEKNIDRDQFYAFLIALEKKAGAVDKTSQLGQILTVCAEHSKEIRERDMVTAVDSLNHSAKANTPEPDKVLEALQVLRHLGVFEGKDRNTQINDEVLKPDSPLRKELMDTIMMASNAGPDFKALDALISYSDPKITSQELKDLQQLQELAERTAFIAEGKSVAFLLDELQRHIDNWALTGRQNPNQSPPSTQAIIDALDALKSEGYLVRNPTTAMWEISPDKIKGKHGDSVMMRALYEQYIAATNGPWPSLIRNGLADPCTLNNNAGQTSSPFPLHTQLQGSNPDHLEQLKVLEQHMINQNNLFTQWIQQQQNLPTP